ncbi:hypothetical protein [uncultured Paraglaciecola sp.]|uniref:hypothetical protein n=1 Tax=uncultured Paraglaciecola sp. TaxID=1765024 RepID=UPI002638C6A6|nr:hypothetical protein [uncultured Paraglaciecola sp.]
MTDTIEVECHIKINTGKAVLVTDMSWTVKAWLPLSQIEMSDSDHPQRKFITMPEWLAREKDLI